MQQIASPSGRNSLLAALEGFRYELELKRGISDVSGRAGASKALASAIDELQNITSWLAAGCLPGDVPPMRRRPTKPTTRKPSPTKRKPPAKPSKPRKPARKTR